jgi:hypothetical protein
VSEERGPRPRSRALAKLSLIGASAQAAIPGLYAWAITVAPAAFTRGSPLLAKVASVVGLVALTTAPLGEGAGLRQAERARTAREEAGAQEAGAGSGGTSAPKSGAGGPRGIAVIPTWTGPTRARGWSVWGFVLSSAIVWALVPGALSAARVDAVRGALGMVGWALFAFAWAGPALRPDPDAAGRIVAGTPLKPRSSLPRGDGAYVTAGVLLALALQGIGWGIAVPERAVLVRVVTIACGVAVLGATTSIALARHTVRVPAPRGVRLRRAAPWLALLAMAAVSGALLTLAR